MKVTDVNKGDETVDEPKLAEVAIDGESNPQKKMEQKSKEKEIFRVQNSNHYSNHLRTFI